MYLLTYYEICPINFEDVQSIKNIPTTIKDEIYYSRGIVNYDNKSYNAYTPFSKPYIKVGEQSLNNIEKKRRYVMGMYQDNANLEKLW